tara:strand:- start:3814 stop:4125 length:312 start_codon:yes stop_codon:yes gene_type:complete
MCSLLDTWALFYVAGDEPLRHFIVDFGFHYFPRYFFWFACYLILNDQLGRDHTTELKWWPQYFLKLLDLATYAGGIVIVPLGVLATVLWLLEFLLHTFCVVWG